MKWFLGTYTSRFSRRHKLFGHVFAGRYKSLVVDGSEKERIIKVSDKGGVSGTRRFGREKLPLAVRLRAETTSTVDWITERLQMGSRGYLNHLLYRRRKNSSESS